MLDAIKNGVVLYCEYPENLRVEAEKNMDILIIFIEDYKTTKGRFPKDLEALRDYAFREYGYKLRIQNPWGEPFQYIMRDDNRVIVEAGTDGVEDLDISIVYPRE